MVSATMFSSLTSKSSINFLYIGLNEPIENLMLVRIGTTKRSKSMLSSQY